MENIVEELDTAKANYSALLKRFEQLSQEYSGAIEELERLRISASKLELKLHSENQKALSAKKVEREFLDTLSHELITPLNGILGMARLLNDTPLTEEARDSIDVIKLCGESLEAKLKNLLDYIQLCKGEIDFIPSVFALSSCIEALIEGYTAEIYNKELEITYIPYHNGYETIELDKDRVEQLMHIFLSNAIKFTNAGHILITSKLIHHAHRSSDSQHSFELQLRITDTGVGISNSNLKHIFRPFEQLDSSNSREFEGLGIGLALAKEIVTQMNGAILVDSTPGQGSTFLVSLPIEVAHMLPSRESRLAEFDKSITISTIHPPNEERLIHLFNELNIPVSVIGFAPKDLPAPGSDAIWIIDYPASQKQSLELHTHVHNVRNNFSHVIALVPPEQQIPAVAKNLFDTVVQKPITLSGIENALSYASSIYLDGEEDVSSINRRSNPVSHKILLVENNPINQKIILHLIGMLGIPVESAQDLDELKTRITATDYSHVLINPHIDPTPDLSLISLIFQTTSLLDKASIVAVTGRNAPLSKKQLEQAGFHAHIELPTQLDYFAEALQVNVQ